MIILRTAAELSAEESATVSSEMPTAKKKPAAAPKRNWLAVLSHATDGSR
jgi:hypothetical protein